MECSNITHCQNSRLILLYRVLSSLDRFYIAERNQQKSRDETRVRVPKPIGSGVGYQKDMSPSYMLLNPYHMPSTQEIYNPEPQVNQRDRYILCLYRGIAYILRDSSIEPGLLSLMRLSLLGHSMEELLRNDSISDCTERGDLYNTFLAALQSIASNPRLVEFYSSERDEVEYTDGLEYIVSGEGMRRVKAKVGGYGVEKDPPLLDLMDNLGKQAETFSRTAGKMPMNSLDANISHSVNLCSNIIAIRQILQSISVAHGRRDENVSQGNSNNSDNYIIASSALAYDELEFVVPFVFSALANSTNFVNPKRTITLAKELSTMATSLPPGIFVRNLPNRPDCIKALIAGPDGTPYFGGLFEFDVFATAAYPAEPPQVQLTTTANGQVRFNPNLYAYDPLRLS